MSVPVRAAASARADIRRGKQFFDERAAGLGDEFVAEVLATFDRIANSPLGYGEVVAGVRAVGLR